MQEYGKHTADCQLLLHVLRCWYGVLRISIVHEDMGVGSKVFWTRLSKPILSRAIKRGRQTDLCPILPQRSRFAVAVDHHGECREKSGR